MLTTITLPIVILCLILYAVHGTISKHIFEKKLAQILNDISSPIDTRMDELVTHMITQNYVVQSRSSHQIQMVKKKTFSFLLGFIFLCLWVVPLLIYFIYYLAKRDTVRVFNFSRTTS